MPIVDKIKLNVALQGINYEVDPFNLPIKPVLNIKIMHKNKVHLIFHEVPENNRVVAVVNNLEIAAGPTSDIQFTTEWMPIRPEKNRWCQTVDQLHNQFVEIVLKPVKKLGFKRGLVAVEISKCDPLDKFKDNKVVLDKSNLEVRGVFYDGVTTICGEMDTKPFNR